MFNWYIDPDQNNTSAMYDVIISMSIQFWLYLIFLIPSILCTLFVLYYLLFDRNLRHALNNHVIIILLLIILFCEVTIYPWMLYYYYNNGIWQRSHILCSIWSFIDWGLYVTQVMLFAWASIERHILIFHDSWVGTRRKRIFLHYLPLGFLLLYCIIFYSIFYFFPPCKTLFNDFLIMCAVSCLLINNVLHMWETIVHQVLPILIIVIFSIALLLRVLWRKHRLHQQIHWRRHRKMTIQLLLIAFLYLLFSFPNTLMILIYLCDSSNQIVDNVFKRYMEFLSYFVILFFPFVCILSLPELRRKITKIIPLKRRTRRIGPEIIIIANNRNNRIFVL